MIGQWSRECVLGASFTPSGWSVGQALDRVSEQRGWPEAITVDNSTEFTSKALDQVGLSAKRQTRLHTSWSADPPPFVNGRTIFRGVLLPSASQVP